LIHIAAPVALALRKPELLRYNGTPGPNGIIEKPGILSVYQKSGRCIMRRTIKDVEGATLVTDCLDQWCIYFEEVDQITFRIS
jgi:hypothetical protein